MKARLETGSGLAHSVLNLVRDVVLVDLKELEVLAVDALHVAGLQLEEVDLLTVLVAWVGGNMGMIKPRWTQDGEQQLPSADVHRAVRHVIVRPELGAAL